jgi:hypothetical protein
MEIYIVTDGDYSDKYIALVCATAALAEQAIVAGYGDACEVFVVTETLPATFFYEVSMWRDRPQRSAVHVDGPCPQPQLGWPPVGVLTPPQGKRFPYRLVCEAPTLEAAKAQALQRLEAAIAAEQ